MANPRAFISFDFDNNENSRMLFVGQIANSRTPFDVEDWSSKSVLPQATWEERINVKINRTHICIVLVGNNMASATGVVKEIAMAKTCNVPICGVYVDGANTLSTLPIGLARNRVIAWKWEDIANMIDEVMKEGKNAK